MVCGDVFVGDEIVEWNGTSLVDSTFEETHHIMESSGDTVQLVLVRTRKPSVSFLVFCFIHL